MTPGIPFLRVPELVLLEAGAFGSWPSIPISIKPFGTLVAFGTLLGAHLALRQGRKVGLHQPTHARFLLWVALTGFIVAHVFDIVFYYPERLAKNPLLLLAPWAGISSFGGFLGALIGALLWARIHRMPMLPYSDVTASSFPVGWLFGRAGCSLAHDHPGMLSQAWYAVQCPESMPVGHPLASAWTYRCIGGGRLDLGLIELVATVPLAAAVLWWRRRPRPWGFYLAAFCLYYAPIRFLLDFLRADDVANADARYAGLTPAQWASFALFGAGVWLAARIVRRRGDPELLRPPESPEPLPGRVSRGDSSA